MNELVKYKDQAVGLVMGYAPKVVLAIITLVVGLWIIGSLARLVRGTLSSRGVDPTLTPFLLSLLGWALKAVLFISVAQMVGVQTTSFVAILGAAGLAVGLALQGSLSNFAGGVLILIFRPYQVGHVIEAQGHTGTVKEIQIFTTTLLTPQNRRVIIPNGALSNGSIINYSSEGTARVDIGFAVDHKSDLEKARSILLDLLKADPRVLTEPAPAIVVLALGENSVNLSVRPFCRVDDYWAVFSDTLAQGKARLDQAGMRAPVPQRDVHIHQH